MNRNVESHFSQLPQIDIQRSIFDRSSSHKTSFNVGELIPIYVDEVLPGDTFKMTTSKVVRLQTLLTPIMDNVYLDVYWFFVPNRLVWEHWKQFCGENTESAWYPTTEYTIPLIVPPDDGIPSHSILDYMGYPVGVANNNSNTYPIALPCRGYALIANEFFRDQNLTDPLLIPVNDSNQSYGDTGNYISDVANGGAPFKVAKYHDYFTSCLPNPQKSAEPVTIGNANSFPLSVYTGPPDMIYADVRTSRGVRGILHGQGPSGDVFATDAGLLTSDITKAGLFDLGSDSYEGDVSFGVVDTGFQSNAWDFIPTNMHVNFGKDSVYFDVNSLRLAFQTQRYLEKLARGGSRYVELIKSFFGVTSPDARIQRPEYLGGNRVPIQIHQVTNSAQSEADFLGDLGAMSVTNDVHQDFEKSFTEHGFLFGLCCVRYDHTYCQGVERMWTRRTFLDHYLPTFANIGEQPVYNKEIYLREYDSADDVLDQSDFVFGYQEAWADYRYKSNRVSGLMRPNIADGLGSWHLADNYAEPPTLSDAWIREDQVNMDRVLAVSSEVSDQCFADFYFDCVCTRAMPTYSIPGLIDHN